MAGATKCPECGRPVSAFAAGCVCGADLEAYHRRERLQTVVREDRERARRLPRIDLRALPVSAYEAVVLVLIAACLIWVPALAILIAALGALHGYYESRAGWAVLCGVLALAGLVLELSLA